MNTNIVKIHGDFILSKDKNGFSEVVESFPKASHITVVTYNLSGRCTGLLEALRKCDVPVRLISMIPGRWPNYWSPSAHQRADAAISQYLISLDPKQFGALTRVFFCFENHAKIVLTDLVGYVGSANYAEESAKNWEAGVIVRDGICLTQINESIDSIQAASIEYFGEKMLGVIAPLLTAKTTLNEAIDRLFGLFSREDVSSLLSAIEDIREVLAEWDLAWRNMGEPTGPLGSRLSLDAMNRIDEVVSSGMFWDLSIANESLEKALDGNIPVDDLPIDSDGNILESAFGEVVDSLTASQKLLDGQLDYEITEIRELLTSLSAQIEGVCKEVSSHMSIIHNTRK